MEGGSIKGLVNSSDIVQPKPAGFCSVEVRLHEDSLSLAFTVSCSIALGAVGRFDKLTGVPGVLYTGEGNALHPQLYL